MAKDTVQVRVTPELKQQADAVFKAIGLKTSEAIRLFLQQAVNSGGLPFRPQAKRPNAATLAAMKEAENPESLPTFKNTDELYNDLGI